MWIKYGAYLEGIHEDEQARAVYKRACEVHCTRKPGVHLAYAGFEERLGNVELAQASLTEFNRRHPNYVAVVLRQISIERRRIAKDE